ncbi:MAG: hypothetical protein QM780_13445 [Hyphomicrobium sp.]|uniref:hypothetical protein n=1 Tax=Hyphomicrobium sp. TaxID=82 RepID=UPI0039E576B4
MSAPATEAKTRSTQAAGVGLPRGNPVAQSGQRNAPQHRPLVHDPAAARAVVIAVLRRIEGYLDEETAALDKSSNFDLKASNDRKSQGLVDLNQAMRRLTSEDINDDLKARLQTFRNKLAINLRKIRLHLDAVKEITAMLSEAIQSAESDGTYTRNIGPYRSAL